MKLTPVSWAHLSNVLAILTKSAVDCILLGPQVRFQKAAIEKLAAGRKAGAIPVDVIDMRDYGTMNGKAVFEAAMKMIG